MKVLNIDPYVYGFFFFYLFIIIPFLILNVQSFIEEHKVVPIEDISNFPRREEHEFQGI